MYNNKESKHYKLVLLGDAGVGKSSIVLRFTDDSFSDFQESTVGSAFLKKQIELEHSIIRFEIWDTAGQEKYRSLAPMYYRGAHVAIVVYDITREITFNIAKKWIKELQINGRKNIKIALVGNKVDLKDKREVQLDCAKNFADTEKLLFFEVSAKQDINITEMFRKLGETVDKIKSSENNIDIFTEIISKSNSNSKSNCCS